MQKIGNPLLDGRMNPEMEIGRISLYQRRNRAETHSKKALSGSLLYP
jgi:hypothetical protein